MDQELQASMQGETVLVHLSDAEMLSFNVICRLCANPNERIIGIYSEEGISNDLATKMNLYLPVKVSETDTLPLQCCWSCASTVLAWHELVVASVEADRRLRGMEVTSDKADINQEFCGINDGDSSGADEGLQLKSPAASLSVFCQESPTAHHQPKRFFKQDRITPPPSYDDIQEQLVPKKEEWINSDVVSEDSLQNYIENIQNPFVVSKVCDNGNVLRKSNYEHISIVTTKSSRKQKIIKVKSISTIPPIKSNSEENSKSNEHIKSDRMKTDECYNFSCQYCPLMFITEDDILVHVKDEHSDKETELMDDMSLSAKMSIKKDRRKNTRLDHETVNAAKVVVDGRIYYNCKICGKSLHSPYTYIWHMRIHTGERPFVCDLCGKQFRVSQGLVRHLRETHEGIKNFGCDICGRMFASRRNVEEHRRIHTNERPYICDLCGKSFKQKASLFVHNRSHTDLFPFRCSYCNQGFRTRPPLLIHVTRHTGEKPYPCDVCGRCFRIKYELKRHKLIHSEEKPFSCNECGLSFRQKRYRALTKSAVNQDPNDTKKTLVAKLEHDTEECYICTICSSKFATETFFIIHQYKRHGIQKPNKDACFTCEVCKTTFKRRCDMRRHFKMQHVEKKQGSFKRRRRRVDIHYEIFCDVCNKGFTRHLDMEKHKNKQHSVDFDSDVSVKIEPKEENDNNELENAKENVKQLLSTDETKTSLTNTDVQICNICEKVFNKKVELNRHLKVEHDQIVRRPRRNKNEIIAHYFCDICSKGFTRKFDMQKHRKSKHPNVPLPQAELTEQQRNIQLLKRCRVPNDDNTNYYQCEVCNRIFRQSYNFMRHQTIHTGIRAYFCHICGKNFRVSGGLHRHITEHHYGVKKYKCDICNQSFAAKATRDDHTNIHTNFRPFICDVCGKAFRQKASLHIHKLFHGDNYRFTCNICGKKYRRASELKIHSWLHTGHKPHQCAICNARFRLRQDLKRHIKIHDKLPESVCKVCGSAFSQERYLKNHMKTHRNEESLPYVAVNS